jgi:hypothetical protein
MKKSYLNGMLNFEIELCVIQKNKKNQNKLLINQRKEEK